MRMPLSSAASSASEPLTRTGSTGLIVFPGSGIYACAYKGRPAANLQVRELDQSSGLVPYGPYVTHQ